MLSLGALTIAGGLIRLRRGCFTEGFKAPANLVLPYECVSIQTDLRSQMPGQASGTAVRRQACAVQQL